jgi:hypothetical protein
MYEAKRAGGDSVSTTSSITAEASEVLAGDAERAGATV